jgi:prepilin-type N-terminal cleavage/methylation domain-containing protein
MTRFTRTRPGVTLIEILVVIAIIGVLLALTTAALQKAAEGQNVKSSELQVLKLQQALDKEYDDIVQKSARESIPREVLDFADGNPSRAKALWTAVQLRLHFPDTFAEATTAVTVGGASFGPLATFKEVQGATSNGNTHDESGALLYIILVKKSASGGGAMATAAEDLTQTMKKKVQLGMRELETFSDAWKNSVGFQRWHQSDEVQYAPYVDPAKDKTRAPSANRDPLDPQNLVLGWSVPGATDPRAVVRTALLFNGQNRMANVYSVGGKDKAFGAEENIFGFRLRKQGNTGRVTP